MYRFIPLLLLFSSALFAQEFVSPVMTDSNSVAQPAETSSPLIVASRDSVLGDRVAKISATMEKIPQAHGQIWREYDITPYTKERRLTNTAPEQVIIDWIIRQTGTTLWHTAPFGILTADSEKLYVYHTKEVQLIIADIVDRFVCQQLWNDACTLRVVSLSRPDWLTKGHAYLKPIPIATPGIQGWILEKTGAQNLLQELGKRGDFKEVIPPQPLVTNGIQHNVVAKKQRQYLRDVQANSAVLNGIAEDRATIEEGVGLALTPLALLDGQNMAAAIKLDVIQIERMISTMIEIPTSANPRQRIQIETPQVSVFKLDEMVRFPKNKVLLLDLGSVPLPNVADEETRNVLSEIAKGINPARRGNMLIFIECTSGTAAPSVTSSPSSTPTRTAESPYWRGVR